MLFSPIIVPVKLHSSTRHAFVISLYYPCTHGNLGVWLIILDLPTHLIKPVQIHNNNVLALDFCCCCLLSHTPEVLVNIQPHILHFMTIFLLVYSCF